MADADPRRSFGFRRRVALARAAAGFETLWAALWPAFAVLGIFLVVSLLGVWALLPAWLHGLGLAALALGLVWSLWRARGAFLVPGHDATNQVGKVDRAGLQREPTGLGARRVDQVVHQAEHRRRGALDGGAHLADLLRMARSCTAAEQLGVANDVRQRRAQCLRGRHSTGAISRPPSWPRSSGASRRCRHDSWSRRGQGSRSRCE